MWSTKHGIRDSHVDRLQPNLNFAFILRIHVKFPEYIEWNFLRRQESKPENSACRIIVWRTITYSNSVTSWGPITYSMEQSPSWEAYQSLQIVNNFPAFYWTRKFITAFTSARHLSLSWASPIQSIPPTSHFLKIHPHVPLPLLRLYQSISPGPRLYL
jgi:hypothetical protein